MGASHSSEPRSVSMDNPNPPGVIDLSDEVVQRLKKGITKQVKENAAAAATQVPTSQPESRAIPIKTATTPAPAKAAATPTPVPTPAPAPVPTPAPVQRSPPIVYQNPNPVYVQSPTGTTITALEVRRQKEIELQQNDAMWRQRMSQLEQTLNKTNTIMEQEYTSAVEDVRKRFATAAPVHQLPPCQDLKAQVIACYRANPGETLKCNEEVAMFRNCVSLNRVNKIDKDEPVKGA